ncbi:MAG TPA: hypothetical protein EYP39_11015 [Ghiorsea sp.]|nr:hypothetical protein [Ghiorsea sp.]HIP06291.1 hypothetical protein [Mariprofundaceae bacterium]
MTYYKKMITIAFAALLFQNTAIADTKYEVEIDPSTFALNGYAFHARILPESMPQWRLGAGIYSMEFPDIFIDMNSKNKGLGWSVTLDQGIGLFAEYFFKTREKGWYVRACSELP